MHVYYDLCMTTMYDITIVYAQVCIQVHYPFCYYTYSFTYIHYYAYTYTYTGSFSWAIVILLALTNLIKTVVEGEIDCEHTPEYCGTLVIQRLVFLSIILCIYVILVMFVSRIYELRLIQYTGVTGASQYEPFLNFAIKEEKAWLQRLQAHGLTPDRLETEAFKRMVDDFVGMYACVRV